MKFYLLQNGHFQNLRNLYAHENFHGLLFFFLGVPLVLIHLLLLQLQNYVKPLQALLSTPQQILSRKQLDIIFCNIEELLSVHESLLEELVVCDDPKWDADSSVRKIFQPLVSFLQLAILVCATSADKYL